MYEMLTFPVFSCCDMHVILTGEEQFVASTVTIWTIIIHLNVSNMIAYSSSENMY